MKRIAVITGASSGMGREFFEQLDRFAMNLDEVWLIARRKDVLEQIARKQNRWKVRVLPMDLQDSKSFLTYEQLLEHEKPDIRLLINAAGYGVIGKTEEIGFREQTGMIRLNCEALEGMTQLSLPYLGKGSKIVIIASGSAFLPQPGFNVYAATKAFALHYGRALGREVRKKGITVTNVCPGPVKTEFFDRAEQIHKSPGYKQFFYASKENVVRRAIIDAKKSKSVSVYGVGVKLLRIAVKILPQEWILKGFR